MDGTDQINVSASPWKTIPTTIMKATGCIPRIVVLPSSIFPDAMQRAEPRFLEYFSLQAPKGEEGLYLGFSHLHSFLSSILGFGLSGFLLSKYCPEPTLFAKKAERISNSNSAIAK